jgi:hypothetical protein
MTGSMTRLMTAALACAALFGGSAQAGGDPAGEPRLFFRLATGPAFNHESWSPDGGSPGASYTAWGPALDVAVGRRVRRGLVVAGDLQLAMLVNRTESYLGGSYPLTDTLHFVDTLSGLVEYTPWSLPRLHFGGGAGVMAATDVDSHMGSTKTSWGWSLSAHAGVDRRLPRGWSVGVMGRLTLYRFGSDTPPPSSTSIGLLPVLLVTFTR